MSSDDCNIGTMRFGAASLDPLVDLFTDNRRVVVLTGAGVSAPSGIPTYRDDVGNWKASRPIQHQQFIDSHEIRQRYWARSQVGWKSIARAKPNHAHLALARLEQAGLIDLLVTQNVDRLHQIAGHRKVVDLHGRLDRVVCLQCEYITLRSDLQSVLTRLNPTFSVRAAEVLPDGDAALDYPATRHFIVPDCSKCGGVLMPDVVFYGGGVPRQRVEAVIEALSRADALFVAGSSLMVYSGFRFCRYAVELGKPVFVLNRGKTRADDIATLKINAECVAALKHLCLSLDLPVVA